jgi:hypothetical protein
MSPEILFFRSMMIGLTSLQLSLQSAFDLAVRRIPFSPSFSTPSLPSALRSSLIPHPSSGPKTKADPPCSPFRSLAVHPRTHPQKYGVVLGLNRPSDFKHTALVSFIACSIAGIVFLFFLRRMRGHILPHWKWLGLPSAREAGHEGTGNSTAVDGGKGKGGDELGLRKRKVEEEDGLGSGGGKP